jgi:formamidopyrimidine-DNA glycosylase
MPELPEVETLKRGLERTILGKTIRSVQVRLPKMVSIGPGVVSNIRSGGTKKLGLFQKLLKGQKIKSIKRRAKMFIIDLAGPYTLLAHLKMTGQLIFAASGERKQVKLFNTDSSARLSLPHKYTHVIFAFTDGSQLYFNDMRQFGYLRLVRDSDLPSVRELREYGPEPLGKDFTLQYLKTQAKRRPGISIKQFLMEPRVIAGIGNIYSDEILYYAKIRPNRRVRSLSIPDWQAIFRNIPKVLKEAIKRGGSSVGDFFQIDGQEGTFGKKHMVYGRYGEYCYVCGSEIEKIKLGGRTSSYCPVCQK